MKCRSCEFGETVFEGRRVVSRCRLDGGDRFFDGDRERMPLELLCPEVRVVYTRGGGYEMVYPEYYCGECREVYCTDPCPLVTFEGGLLPSSSSSGGAA